MKLPLTLGQKLLAFFGALTTLALLAAGALILVADQLGGAMEEVINGPARKLDRLGELVFQSDAVRIASRNVIVYSFTAVPELVKVESAKFDAASVKITSLSGDLRGLMSTDAEKAAFHDLETNLASWISITRQVDEKARQGDPIGASAMAQKEARPFAQGSDRAKTGLLAIERQMVESERQGARQQRARARWAGIAAMAMAVVVAGFVLASLRRLQRQLRAAVRDLTENARQMSAAGSQVASSSESLARTASQQAASLEETAASAEEISSISRTNAASASTAASTVAEVDGQARRGDAALGAMNTSMNEINASSERISKILHVIDEIAFQTNILALNAAIEAARAGDAGLGFAVVADEVRNLARRSAQAAKDTAALVEESLTKAGSGRESVQQVTTVFRAISEGASRLKGLIDGVDAGSREQARGMVQIAQTVAQIDHALQSTAASAEESASASAQLAAQFDGVRQVAARLAGMVGAGKGEQ